MEKQIVVIGAGYAGLMCALRLAGKSKHLNIQVTLINGSDVFVERPLLHEVATNNVKTPTPITEMIRGTRINFIHGWMTNMHAEQNQIVVKTADELRTIQYDYLVYALGSMVDLGAISGLREYAYALNPHGEKSAEALRKKLLTIKTGRVVVIGGGATGIEGATQIRSLYPDLDVTLVTRGKFGTFKGERVEKHLRDGFAKQGITVLENHVVDEIQDGQIVMSNGSTLDYDVCLWAGGFVAPTLARTAGLQVNDRHQILADPYLRSISHENIYVVGDSASPVEEPGNQYRMSLNVALITGAHVADNLVRLLKSKAQKPLSFVYYGQGIAMGTDDAIGFFGYPDDKPHGMILRGKVAVRVRNFFVWLITKMLHVERRYPGFFVWVGQGRYEAQLRHRASHELKGQSL